jgi:uncharacterized protein YoxC
MALATFSWGDLAYLALAIFLIVVGVTLGYSLVRLGETFSRLSSLIRGTERDVLPVVTKVGGTVDRVNDQLDKLDQVTDSAVDVAESVDTTVRAVSMVVTKPVQKVAGFTAGVTHGASAFKTEHGWRNAVRAGKEAAARREQEIADELRASGGGDQQH